MSRRSRATKRPVAPDPRFQSVLISKFINQVMQRGKKTVAQGIMYDALDIIKEKGSKDPLRVFDAAVRNVSPVLEIKARRIGGANYQIPVEVRGSRREALAVRWIIEAAKSKKGQSMANKLASEFLDAANNTGGAIKKKQDTHRMAESNKAFAHYA
jgi:small subunit ribosomal protein S7